MQSVIAGGKPVIIVDDRERGSRLAESLKSYDVLLRVSRIDVGDYVISDRIVVERKSFRDFEASVMDGRIFSQASKMLKYQKPLIVIEPGRPERLSRNAVYGAMASLLSDYGINVVFMPPEEAAALLARMAIREQTEMKRKVSIVRKPKAWNHDDARIRIVAGFPGISAVKAEKLLSHFSTLHNLFSATEQELMKVEGIGIKRSKEMLKIIYGEYKRGDNHVS